jgi:uncharacterized protein
VSDVFGISERSMDIVKKALARFPEIERALIFGSRAMGNYKSGSDIDLAISGREVGTDTARRLSVILNEEEPLPYKVDVVAYAACENEELKRHIDEWGRPLCDS